MIKVFVYGTLRDGESNAYLLQNSIRLAEQSWTQGRLYDTGFGYPALEQSDSTVVFGELYSVTEEELQQLDYLEDYSPNRENNNLYERVEQKVFTDNGLTTAYV